MYNKYSFVFLLVIILALTSAETRTVESREELPRDTTKLWREKTGASPGHAGDFFKTAISCDNTASVTGTDDICLTDLKTRLTITKIPTMNKAVTCEQVSWEAADCTVTAFEECFNMATAHWYGGTVIRRMTWPVETWRFRSFPYVTGDGYTTPEEYGGVQERYWMNSNGTAYFVDWDVPLWVSINESNSKELCFRAQYLDSPYNNYDHAPVVLNYTVCQGTDVRTVHDYMSATYISRPIGIPDEQLFRYPIWSTWAQYKRNVTQEKVMEFAQAINDNNFDHSQIEIDDRWEVHYGDMDFDRVKFPDPQAMVRDLNTMGFRVTLWIHPFVNLDSTSLNDGMTLRAYVLDPGATLPALTSWWSGSVATTLDFTETRAQNWFTQRIGALRTNYNISSFKFDAGESNWLPNCYRLSETARNPSIYSTRYAEISYSLDSEIRHQEVRVGARSQHLPIFVRMMDKDSEWGWVNGLETLIPHAINFGLIGYPFVLPDMVGGNGYVVLPDRELFIRWMELNVFLPSIQFSIAPWQFDEEVINITRKMIGLHEQYSQTFIDLAKEATLTGAPIVRPLWWIAPLDPVAQVIASEFLVGDKILVAPVVTQGALARNIYLPAGLWHDEHLGVDHASSGEWLMGYAVALDELAYFTLK